LDLNGNLAVFEPVNVFQLISYAQRSGQLTLECEDNSARVFFNAGVVTYAEISRRRPRLGEYLVEKKVINQRALDGALVKSQKNKKKLGHVLLNSGVITEEELRSALEVQVKEVVYEVVRWRKGKFSFENDKMPTEQEVKIDIPLDHLMLEGFKRMDEEEGNR